VSAAAEHYERAKAHLDGVRITFPGDEANFRNTLLHIQTAAAEALLGILAVQKTSGEWLASAVPPPGRCEVTMPGLLDGNVTHCALTAGHDGMHHGADGADFMDDDGHRMAMLRDQLAGGSPLTPSEPDEKCDWCGMRESHSIHSYRKGTQIKNQHEFVRPVGP
jgi:hypothetical protein